jgi:hypothetical protein
MGEQRGEQRVEQRVQQSEESRRERVKKEEIAERGKQKGGGGAGARMVNETQSRAATFVTRSKV